MLIITILYYFGCVLSAHLNWLVLFIVTIGSGTLYIPTKRSSRFYNNPHVCLLTHTHTFYTQSSEKDWISHNRRMMMTTVSVALDSRLFSNWALVNVTIRHETSAKSPLGHFQFMLYLESTCPKL